MNRYFHKMDYGRYLFESDLAEYSDADIVLMAAFLVHDREVPSDEAIELLIQKMEGKTLKTTYELNRSVKGAVARMLARPFVDIHQISIYQDELDKIAEIPSATDRKVMFTLLCFAKYNNALNPNNNNWVNFDDTMIKKSAGVHSRIRDYNLTMYNLKEMGMIAHSKKVTKNNILVKIIHNDEVESENDEVGVPPVMSLDDLRGLGAVYAYTWGRFLTTGGGRNQHRSILKYCKECGAPFLDGSPKHGRQYCFECRKIKYT